MKMQDDNDTLFGYHFSDSIYGPTPPPEISTIGAPILTSDEYKNSRQFLDFFTANGPEDAEFLTSLRNASQDSVPNIQGVSSTFGRPEVIEYEYVAPPTTSCHHDYSKGKDTEDAIFVYPKPPNQACQDEVQELSVHATSANHLFPFHEEPFRLLVEAGEVQQHQISQRPSQKSQRAELGFGSDSCFTSQHYAPPPGTTDIQAVEGRVLETLNSFQPSRSAANTQPSSPMTLKNKRSLPETTADPHSELSSRGQVEITAEKSDRDAISSSLKDASNSEPRKKTKKGQRPFQQAVGEASHRRKPRASEPKRQNLTEKEKKENHIRSEQKRRNQIREGFANLLAMMPAGVTEGSSNSKCIVLAKAVDWLNDLQDGNERLRAYIRSLDAAPLSE